MSKTCEYKSLCNLIPVTSGNWRVIVVSDLEEVQDLLEALEAARFTDRTVFIVDRQRYAVAWK